MATREDDSAVELLLVDDDTRLCSLLSEYLSGEGFRVDAVHDGESGLARALAGGYSVVVLDIMLPGMHGLEVLRRLRAESNVPVMMLTARGEDVDRIVGLEVGADDYLAKPFNTRELLARLRAILRRSAPVAADGAPSASIVRGDIVLDPARRAVTRSGEEVVLTAAEFDLLALFLQRPGEAISREEIAEDVLGRSFYAHDRSIDMHVSKLRRKLGAHPDGSERFKSIRAVGYLYTPPPDAGAGGE